MTYCDLCGIGTEAPGIGSVQCDNCVSGKYGDVLGPFAFTCSACVDRAN